MSILLTGGAGYIGSHTAVELLQSEKDVVIVDNFSNSSKSVIERIERIVGKQVVFYDCDASDECSMERVFSNHKIDIVIHFAGFKSVAESIVNPVEYYRNNLDTILTVLKLMDKFGCKHLVFSSSATVYSNLSNPPFKEDAPTGACTNPYGWSKYMIERIIMDACSADPGKAAVILRYFNPIGAHASGLIGELPKGIPNNLMPVVSQTAAGKHEIISVFGNDYDTPDGTCIRDYIHVVDLAKGHVAACDYLTKNEGIEIFNLGTGRGYSVLELINSFSSANGVKIPYEIASRREGDIPVCFADVSKAKRLLNWQAEKTLEDACIDVWRWETNQNYI